MHLPTNLSLALCLAFQTATAAPGAKGLGPKPPTAIAVPPAPPAGNTFCAGSGGSGTAWTDKLACPAQPGAVDIICADHGSIDNWYTTCGPTPGGECSCINGNFCCNAGTTVAGGQPVVDYFNDVGCNCNG